MHDEHPATGEADAPGPEANASPAQTSPPQEHDLEALRVVEEAAAAHWQALPDKPDMAVPASEAGLEAVQVALQRARELRPSHPDILAKLKVFDSVLEWAGASRFAGSYASPIGAVVIAIALLVQAFAEARLPGTRNELLLYAALLVIQAPLYRLCARRTQLEVNARFLAGTQDHDERFVRWLLSKGALVFSPLALLRALLYGMLIPASTVYHLVRRKRFAGAALLAGANLAVLLVGTNLPRGLVIEESSDFQAGVDIFGHWVPYDAPLSSLPADVQGLSDTGWKLHRSDESGGLDASVWVHQSQLGDSSMRVWAKADAGPDNKYLQLYRSSAEALQARWGKAGKVRSETNESSGCEVRWLTYEHSGSRLSVKENVCRVGGRQTLSRNLSAPVVTQ